MYDIDLVSRITKGVTQSIEVHRIATKTVRGIEGREVKEP